MRTFFLIILLSTLSCRNEKTVKDTELITADDIINKAIEIAGGSAYRQSVISFDFRDISYRIFRNQGQYRYERIMENTSEQIHDILSNSGFTRQINGIEPMKIPDSMKLKYSSSINSVQYFASLPYGLNDEAVIKERLGEEVIAGETYYKIKVTFTQDGGGEDYEDIFIYWINEISFKPNYLAYSYNEEDGIGMRFREAYNERYVNGLRFVDYRNYKPDLDTIALENLGQAFVNEQLELVSDIVLNNIKVTLLSD